jgi:hypothetical protein
MPINIITYKNTEYTHSRLISPLEKRGIKLRIINYDKLFKYKRFPVGTYIFTDRERLDVWQQQAVAEVHMALSEYPDCYKTFNNPAKILGKLGALRLLYKEKINAFNGYAVIERNTPSRFPVFLKTEYEHKKPLSELLWNQQELDAEIKKIQDAQVPLDGVIITEYCSEPYRGDIFRRLSSYIIGDNISFAGSVHEKSWCVKYGAPSLVGDEEYREEQSMIKQNYRCQEIQHIARLLNISYGRVDYNVVDGHIAVYEINTNPSIVPFDASHANPIRNKNNQVIFENYLNNLVSINHDCKRLFAPKIKNKLKILRRS